MIQFIPLGVFQPDAPRYGSDAIDHLENLVPSFGGYRSVRQKETRSDNPAPASNRGINGAYAHIYLEDTTDQTARPDGVDGTPLRFRSNQSYTQVDLHELVDGLTPSDTEFVVAGGGQTGDIEFTIPELQTPASAPNWVIRIRYRIDDHATGTHSVTYTLLDGASILRGPITVVSSTDADSGGWVTYEDTFTGNVAWAMDDLRILLDTVVDGPDIKYYPEADSDNSDNWRDEGDNLTDLYASIDETSDNDTDYVKSSNVTGIGSEPEVAFDMQEVGNPWVDFDGGDTPFSLHARGRVNHDNLVAGYQVLNNNDSVVVEGTFDFATHASTFGDATAVEIDVTDITNLDSLRLVLNADITAAWKNAEGTSGTAEADNYVNYFPTSDDISGSHWTGSYADVDDVADDGNEVTFTAFPLVVHQEPNFLLGNYEYPGIQYGSVLKFRWRKDASATSATVDVVLHDGTTDILTTTLITTSSTPATEDIALDTTAVMNAVKDASNLYVRIDQPGAARDSFHIQSIYLVSPEPAKVYVSRAYFDVWSTARASVSWVEMQVPSSSTGYIDDKVYIHAGDLTDLYTVDETGFVDVSGTTYAAGTDLARPWDFASWGNDIIATNYVDPVQIRSDGTGNFADMITSTSKPKARFVTTVRNQVFLGHCENAGGTVDMVWWSGIDDAADFEPSLTTQADYQRLRDTPGQITGLVGGQYATIFKRHSIYRADYVGLPVIYDFRLVSQGIGTPFPRSIVSVGEDIYFFTGSGFAVLQGGSRVSLIGDESVSRFIADLDFSNYALTVQEESQDVFEDLAMFGAYDPHSRLIFWFYSGPNGFMFEDDTSPADIRNVVYNDAIVYDTRTGRWSYMNFLRGKTEEDSAVNATAAINMFKPQLSHTSWTRGLGMFGWDNGTDHGEASGMTQTYIQFDNEAVFPSLVKSKVFTIEDGKDVTIFRVRPIFTAVPEASADPAVTVTMQASQDPLFTENLVSDTFANQDSDGWYLGKSTGEYFQVEFQFGESNDEFIREVIGFQIDFQITGSRGG